MICQVTCFLSRQKKRGGRWQTKPCYTLTLFQNSMSSISSQDKTINVKKKKKLRYSCLKIISARLFRATKARLFLEGYCTRSREIKIKRRHVYYDYSPFGCIKHSIDYFYQLTCTQFSLSWAFRINSLLFNTMIFISLLGSLLSTLNRKIHVRAINNLQLSPLDEVAIFSWMNTSINYNESSTIFHENGLYTRSCENLVVTNPTNQKFWTS